MGAGGSRTQVPRWVFSLPPSFLNFSAAPGASAHLRRLLAPLGLLPQAVWTVVAVMAARPCPFAHWDVGTSDSGRGTWRRGLL